MKIVQINAIAQGSSTGRTCKELQNYINQNTEHTCYTAFAQNGVNECGFKIGNSIEWKLHGLFSRIFGKQAHFSHFGTRKLLKFLDNIKPDVVILRNLHGNYLNLPLLLKYLAKNDVASIVVLHDCWFYTGKCTHYTVDGCYKWQTGCYECPRLKKDNISWFVDATNSMWKEKKTLFEAIPNLAVIGVSDWITEEAKKSYLACAKNIIRVYNWIDLDSFYPKDNLYEIRDKYGLKKDNIILGVASGWSNLKGLDVFISLANMLGEEYQVVLVGSMATKNDLPENIINIPPISIADELADLYSVADVFVTTSLEESFGKVSAEALACGTPVVCFDSTANKEIVGERCGYAVKPGDLSSMASAIKTVCCSAKDDYRINCREYAERKFNSVTNIQEYINIMNEMINRRQN